MDEQVANRQLARDVGVVELEPGQVVDDGRVPLELALLDEQADAPWRVNTFVFDAMPNSVFASTGAGSPSLRTP